MEPVPGRSLLAGDSPIGITGGSLKRTQTGHIIGGLPTTRAEHLALGLHTDGVAVGQADEFKPRGTNHAVGLPTDITRQRKCVAKGQ